MRDLGLLESALAQPQSAFGDQYAHDGLFAMAAAYLFHIARYYPFVDGNKRTFVELGLSRQARFSEIRLARWLRMRALSSATCLYE